MDCASADPVQIADPAMNEASIAARQQGVMLPCLTCGSTNTATIRSRINSGGDRWRLIRCHDCPACSEYIGDQPRNLSAPPLRPFYRHSDAVLRRMLMTRCSNAAMAQELGCSSELVRQIRKGILHRNRVPEVPRWGSDAPPPIVDGPSCLSCQHWGGEQCSMGFPDPEEEGTGFARDCSLFHL